MNIFSKFLEGIIYKFVQIYKILASQEKFRKKCQK